MSISTTYRDCGAADDPRPVAPTPRDPAAGREYWPHDASQGSARFTDLWVMRRSRFRFARSSPADSVGRWIVSPVVVVVLVLLSAWSVAYELGDTLLPAVGNALPFSGIAPDIAFLLASVLLIGRGFSGERGWALIGAGGLCWAAGDIYWTLALSNVNPPVPSWADAGYLLFCPLAFAGILSLVRRRIGGAPRTIVVDALAAALAAGALSAAVVVQPVLANAQGGTLAVATNLAYPVSDLLLLGLIVGATALGNWRLNRTWMLLAASMLVFWIADSLYLITTADRHLPGERVVQPAVVLVTRARRVGGLAAAPGLQAGSGGTGRRARNRDAARVCRSSARDLGVVKLRHGGRARDRVGDELPARDHVPPRHDMARELTPAARKPARGDDRSADRAAQSTRARSDLERRISTAGTEHGFTLVMFDLDGFKHYNDNFGHPAGDALLQRLGTNLASHARGMRHGLPDGRR